MCAHVCPWWGGYFIDNRLRRWLHKPERILAPYVQPGMTALDFGCGMGLFSIAMARLVGDAGRVIAADLQPQMLEVLSRRAAKAGLGVRICTHQCAADRIGIDQRLDFALAFYSAHEVPDLRRLLAEIHSLLVPQGRLLVVEPIGHVTARAFANMLALAKEVGFQARERPAMRLSRAVVLQKTSATQNP